MKIGFSNGNFWRLDKDDFERMKHDSLQRFLVGEANAIEVHCLNAEMLRYLLKNNIAVNELFEYISLHAPCLPYNDNSQSHEILLMITEVCEKYKIKNVVFHADNFSVWDIVKSYNMPVSIENNDNNKNFGKTIDEMRSILDNYDFKLTLDLQHCFTNDPTMGLAIDLQNLYKDRIVEYHISGYDKEKIHCSLFKASQDIIIESLMYPKIPIIIESEFESYDQAEKEINYIKDKINF